MNYSEQLRSLADDCLVATHYRGQDGNDIEVSDETLASTLRALGLDFDESQESVEAAQRQLGEQRASRYLPPTVVATTGTTKIFPVHVVDGDSVDVWVETESGERVDCEQVEDLTDATTVDGVTYGQASFAVPDIELGWHTLHASSPQRGEETTMLVMTPQRLSAADKFVTRPANGLMAQLYSVRDAGAWGVGDFLTLATLARHAASAGSDFVLTNPLHAAEPFPPVEDSPYLPTTRRYINPIYIRPGVIPEASKLSPEQTEAMNERGRKHRAANFSADYIERNPIYLDKLLTLKDIYEVPRSDSRELSFAKFVENEGVGLTHFCDWCAEAAADFWEEQLGQTPDLKELANFYRWMQWIVDEQLASAQISAKDSGMEIGLMADLAVGVHPGGSDANALEPFMAPKCSVGAPPDGYNQMGQDWSQPPWHPWKLAEAGYLPWRDMLRTVLRHSGGIRVDHVLGLFRLWWIHRPEPGTPSDPRKGTYVYYDHEAMVGILALEAERAGAVVVGEDLGTFEPWVQDYLQSRGILGTSILWFENVDGEPRAQSDYRQLCLASVTTHDLPPTAGYLAGEHISLRERLGVLKSDPAVEYAEDLEWQNKVLNAVRAAGAFAGTEADVDYSGLAREDRPDSRVIIEGLHRFLAQSPAALTCTSLVDIVGDVRAQNQPGTTQDMYRNWCVPLCNGDGEPVLLEDLVKMPEWANPCFHSR